ncbi:MAG: hypothetical protein HYU99_01910 [Deltaproteobacteria bacterium]|nr:hypothetical protein [Deltaproteobacteria bacterium]
MGETVTYTTDQSAQIDDLKSYVEEYCEANGIDPAIYTSALDGDAIDPELLSDPAFQAYWQLAYLQLMEILYPETVQSVYAEVGEVDFDSLYAAAGDEINEFMANLVADNPDLMAFSALTDGDSETSADTVTALIEEKLADAGESGGSTDYVDEQARDLAEELGLSGMWDYLIETEEGIKSTENYLMGGLAELDQQLADLQEALESGEITAEEFSAQVEGISMYRELYVGLIQNLEDAWGNLIEMFSQLLKTQQDGQMAIARNLAQNA